MKAVPTVVRLFPDVLRPPRVSKYPSLKLFPAYSVWPNHARWHYAIGFTNGLTKIGCTGAPRERIRTLTNDAGGQVEWVHLFGSWRETQDSAWIESRACDLAAGEAQTRHGSEWFGGLTREQALDCVRQAVAQRLPLIAKRKALEVEKARVSAERKKKRSSRKASA